MVLGPSLVKTQLNLAEKLAIQLKNKNKKVEKHIKRKQKTIDIPSQKL